MLSVSRHISIVSASKMAGTQLSFLFYAAMLFFITVKLWRIYRLRRRLQWEKEVQIARALPKPSSEVQFSWAQAVWMECLNQDYSNASQFLSACEHFGEAHGWHSTGYVSVGMPLAHCFCPLVPRVPLALHEKLQKLFNGVAKGNQVSALLESPRGLRAVFWRVERRRGGLWFEQAVMQLVVPPYSLTKLPQNKAAVCA